jgi:glutathione synthase/RimK-type ligase-like ATP-grasp enzyme
MPASVSTFHLAIATSSQLPGIYSDDVYFVSVLERLGIRVTTCIWNDPAVDWTRFDAVLIRTVWDYFQHYEAFLAWLDTLDHLGVPTINDSRLIRWNSEKRYLLDIEQQGVAIIPTRIARADTLHATLASMPVRDVVIKPTVSGGAWHTIRGTTGTAAFQQAFALLPNELDYLVQPFVPEIASNGEWSLLYFGGTYSHAVIKHPAAGDYRVQEQHGGTAREAIPDPFIINAADKALAAVTALGHHERAYVRVDGVVIHGQFHIMELELIEPLLHLTIRPDAAERLAEHILDRLRHLPHKHDLAKSAAEVGGTS